MSGGWGASPWGAGEWGAGSVEELQLIDALALRENVVRLRFNTAPRFTRTHDANASAATMWHSSGGAVAGSWLLFDLGTQYQLNGTHIWQMNQPCCLGRGVKTFGIFTSPNLTDPV